MATSAHPRVFLSYARTDGAELAQRLRTDLASHGYEPWLDTREIAGGDSWTDEIEAGIDCADAVLALLTPGSFASRICRAEQLRALRKKRLVIPLLAKKESDIPLHLESDHYLNFSGSKPYEAQFQILLEDIGKGRGGVRLKEEYRTTYVTAPPLPLNFVPRTEELKSLRQFVVTDADGIGVALTALEGMGGIGKTMLAQSLCHDQAIQQAFPDGVLWVTAGQEPVYDLRDRINEVRIALDDQPASTESELTCINRYRGLLRDKAVLLVVDDVWRVADIEPFLAESEISCVLFTTRDASIAASLGARECHAGLLSPEKSREILGRYSGVSLSVMPPEWRSLIGHCGRLPLALAMVGAMLRGKPPIYWQRVVTLLQNADLAKIRAQFPHYPHADLLKCIQVSVDVLGAEQRERYLALAALLEDMSAVSVLQQALWDVDAGDAMDTTEQFIALSLAQRDGEGIRLHDLQLDYVRAHFPDRAALDLIHGAIRLSADVITSDPGQFASQMMGRLLPHLDLPAVVEFIEKAARRAATTWLRPLQATLHPSGTSLIRTFQGHAGAVRGVALSADGRRAVSASEDKTLKVWDVESGRVVHTLEGHSAAIYCVALSADGRRAVSMSLDETLKAWDLEIGRIVRTLEVHSDSSGDCALSADGRRAVVYASTGGTLMVWDVETGRVVNSLECRSSGVIGLALSADGRRAFYASYDDTLNAWDLETGRVVYAFEGYFDAVNGVALSADERRAVSASSDKTLKVWDLETGRLIHTLETHSRWVNGVALSADGRRAVFAYSYKTLGMWDVESGRLLHTLEGHSELITDFALSADGRRVVSASKDKTLKVWDMESDCLVNTQEGHSEAVSDVALSADGRRAVSASNDRTLKVWEVEIGRVVQTLEGHSAYVGGAALSANGRRAISASGDRTLKVWDVERSLLVHTLEGHSDVIPDVALSADGRRAVSASMDKTLKVWDVENGHAIHILKGHSDGVLAVALSADGRRAVSASVDRTLKVWDVESGRLMHTLEDGSGSILGVALRADGRRAVSTSSYKKIKVWNVETGRLVHTLEGHSNRVNGVGLSADGRRAVSASDDRMLKVWDLDVGKAIATFTCDGQAVCCAIVADLIVAGDNLGRVHFLRLEEPKPRR